MKKVLKHLKALGARIKRTYYYEDYKRVYPDRIEISSDGTQKAATETAVRNFLNHRKFYLFAAQFAGGRKVADIGCGSGYGCRILKEQGASSVHGYDASRAAVEYARSRYGDCAEFDVQLITRMDRAPGGAFDLSVCSEVLEHVKEYGKEGQALSELKRITRKGGLVIVGTPNSEMLGRHGFSFDEIDGLFSLHFSRFVIFENAFVPFDNPGAWRDRLDRGRTGVVVSQKIDLEETVLPEGAIPEIKEGIAPGVRRFLGCDVDTSLLHNTHSWVVMAVNE
jgi:2-polyprenyl-3-methyl-5-hydroxy-6-metoxy-1,4-benzoquinol methylase